MPEGVAIATTPRGQDFKNKFLKGEWSEALIYQTLKEHDEFLPVKYGISRDDPLQTEAELDNVKEPGVREIKRPDILVFHTNQLDKLNSIHRGLLSTLNHTDPDTHRDLLQTVEDADLPSKACMALEAEASRFNITEREYNSSLSAYVKDEDYPRLANWKLQHDVPMYIFQAFFDRAYLIPFNHIEQLADQSANGDTITEPGFEHVSIEGHGKPGYKIRVETFEHAYLLGELVEPPRVVTDTPAGTRDCQYDWGDNGKLQTETHDPRFVGGSFEPATEQRLAHWAQN